MNEPAPFSSEKPSEVAIERLPRGAALLHDPTLNKGTAFTDEEREALGLQGMLPPRVLSMDAQAARAIEILDNKPTDLERYIYLIALQDRNETLFYRVVTDHLRKLMPIIYTPTVGKACELYGHIFRRPRGLWISANDRGHIADIMANWPQAESVRIIVVTDGERILGLGDLGADGMGIPVGKLTLYTACAGIPPEQCLPVTIDIGTNNVELRKDPLYIGLQRCRLSGHEYDTFIEEFLQAAKTVFPQAIVQLEDFANQNAFRLLQQYRDTYCLFDDDIQGTGSVILGGLLAAQRLTERPLTSQRFLFLGAGEAAVGISDLIVAALVHNGLTKQEALKHCWLFDSKGLVTNHRNDLAEFKRPYAHEYVRINDFRAAIQSLQPSAIIGVSGQFGAFNRAIIHEMASINQRPIIFALSNPTSKCECTARQAYEWTDARAIFASGSPFDPIALADGTRMESGQGNNAYIFPGIGLGAIACGARQITDEMFYAASCELAEQVTDDDLHVGRVFPAIERIREVSAHIAAAVCREAYRSGLATLPEPEDLLQSLRDSMYVPAYREYI